MEKIIKLTEEDIAQIIAEHFHVDRTKVSLTTNKVCVGYGPAESTTYKIAATVKEG